MRFQKGPPTSEAFSKVAIFIRVFNHFNGDNRRTYRRTIGENTSECEWSQSKKNKELTRTTKCKRLNGKNNLDCQRDKKLVVQMM